MSTWNTLGWGTPLASPKQHRAKAATLEKATGLDGLMIFRITKRLTGNESKEHLNEGGNPNERHIETRQWQYQEIDAAVAIGCGRRFDQAIWVPLYRAQSGSELSRSPRFAGQLRREPAADAALQPRENRGADRPWLRQGKRQADDGYRP